MQILVIVVFLIAIAGLAYLSLGMGAAMFGYSLLKAKGGTAPSWQQPTAGSQPPPLTAGWAFKYSSNMVPGQTPESFDFPTQNGVHYCVQQAPPLVQGQTISLTFSITGNGTLAPVEGNIPCVTLFMQRAGDNLSGTGPYEFYRAWGSAVVIACPGEFTVSTPLIPEKWNSVKGHVYSASPEAFAGLLANAQSVGFTCGDPGAGATGHGIYVKDGSAHFTLTGYTIG